MKTNKKTNALILGENSSSPFFNTFVAFIGQNVPDVRVPHGNFARSLLCIFMLYALVLQNSYSGALFEIMSLDKLRKPHVQTIDEMVKKNFKFYMQLPGQSLPDKGFKNIYDRRVRINASDYELMKMYEKLRNPHFKGGLMSSLDSIQYFNSKNYKNFTLNICPEHLYPLNFAIYFPKNAYILVERFNKEIKLLKESGIIKKFTKSNILPEFDKVKTSENHPKVLNLDQLYGSFIILIFGLTSALFVFCIEFVFDKFYIKMFVSNRVMPFVEK